MAGSIEGVDAFVGAVGRGFGALVLFGGAGLGALGAGGACLGGSTASRAA